MCFGFDGLYPSDEKGNAVKPLWPKSAAAPATVNGEQSRNCHWRIASCAGKARQSVEP